MKNTNKRFLNIDQLENISGGYLSTEYITWDQVRVLRVKGPQIGNTPMGQ